MGGRGSSSMSNPKVISLDDYLGRQGLSMPVSDYMLDKVRLPHGATQRQLDKMKKDAAKAENVYQQKRGRAIDEYSKLLADGKIRKPSKIEELMGTASGRPENAATQAARNALDKRGIDWKTGKPKTASLSSSKKPAPKTSYTKKQLAGMGRSKLVNIAREVAVKMAPKQGVSEAEALRRFDMLVSSNSDAQLRNYINKNGK